MLQILLFVAVISLAISNTWASGCDPEAFSRLAVPPAIRRQSAVLLGDAEVKDLARLKAAAIRFGPGRDASAALASLEDGIHVYLVDEVGNGVLMNRLNPPPRARGAYLVTHDGPLQVLGEELGKGVQVVSAGEVIVRGGRVLAVSNKSGKFRGKGENLEFGWSALRRAGLRTNDRTRLQDYSRASFPDPHILAAAEAKLELAYRTDPELKRILQKTQSVMSKTVDIDIDRIYREELSNPPPNEEPLRNAAVYLVGKWRETQDSEVFHVNGYLKRFGEAEFQRILAKIEEWSRKYARTPD